MHITEKVRHLYVVSKEYYITGRANLIFCAVGLRQIHGNSTLSKNSLYFRQEFIEGQLHRKSGLHVL